MKIVVIGGSGLIGKKLVQVLNVRGHHAVPASPSTGVNALTGEGLAEALAGADVVVDVSNSPSFEDAAVLAFFEISTRHLLAAEAEAGVRQHVALSVVGADRMADGGYMRAKVAQEELIRTSGIPYTILRATQFLEFLGAIADTSTVGEIVRLPHARFQPVAADDVAETLARLAIEEPLNTIVELGGPEAVPMDDLIRRYLQAKQDHRQVVADSEARYFGYLLDDHTLVPSGEHPFLGSIHFEDWMGLCPVAGWA